MAANSAVLRLEMPAEHGAWGILLAPLVCAAAVAGAWNLPLLLCVITIISLFLLRGSLEAPAKGSNSAGILTLPHSVLAVLALASGAALVFRFQRTALLTLSAIAAALYLLQRWLVRSHRQNASEKRSLAAELVGAVLLSLAAPAAWITARGSLLDRPAEIHWSAAPGVMLWLLNLLFFLGGILYVKYRVRGLLAHREFHSMRERLAFAWPVFAYYALLVCFLTAWIVRDPRAAAFALAFAPSIVRAHGLLFHLGRRFPIRQLGWSEVAHSAVFALLLILAFRL